MKLKCYENVVSKVFGIEDLFRNTKKMEYIEARVTLFYLLRQYTDLKYIKLGEIYGFVHSNIRHHVINMEFRLKYDKNLRDKVETCKKMIENFADMK